MKRTWAFFILLVFTVACNRNAPAPQGEPETPPVPKAVVEKAIPERQEPLPPEVKIRLKRDGKESYSWELSGSDVDQILKVNEKLRKKLGAEQNK